MAAHGRQQWANGIRDLLRKVGVGTGSTSLPAPSSICSAGLAVPDGGEYNIAGPRCQRLLAVGVPLLAAPGPGEPRRPIAAPGPTAPGAQWPPGLQQPGSPGRAPLWPKRSNGNGCSRYRPSWRPRQSHCAATRRRQRSAIGTGHDSAGFDALRAVPPAFLSPARFAV